MRHALATGLVAMALGVAAAAVASTPAPDTTTARRPCAAPEHRQFDFWIGAWDVRTPDGAVAGTNVIEPILGGCVLLESWTGARGLQGRSFNLYDARDRKWHQTWVDGQGSLLALAGQWDQGRMVLVGDAPDGSQRNRITWTPLPDGTVRQHWQVSTDKGATWTDAFLGIYTRRK